MPVYSGIAAITFDSDHHPYRSWIRFILYDTWLLILSNLALRPGVLKVVVPFGVQPLHAPLLVGIPLVLLQELYARRHTSSFSQYDVSAPILDAIC